MNQFARGDITGSARNEAAVQTLNPAIRQDARKFLNNAFMAGHNLLITEGYRSGARQDELYAQGRNGNPGDIVTNAEAGESYHNYGMAFDVVPLDKRGRANWKSGSWTAIGELGEAAGFEWGGRWGGKKQDRPHFQGTAGYTEGELKALADDGKWSPAP